MTKRDKRLERLRKNPKNVSFDELRLVLEDHGFIPDRSSGSHHQFRASKGGQVWRLTIPLKRPYVKTPYVLQALQAIDEMLQLDQDDSESEDDNGSEN